MDVLSMETGCCAPSATPFIPWQTLPSALRSPGCAQATASALCTIKSPFYTKHAVSHSPEPHDEGEMSARESGHSASNIRGDGPTCGRHAKRQSRIEVRRVRCGCCRQHSPRLPLLLYAPAPVHTLQHPLRGPVTVFTQRWRPSSFHSWKQSAPSEFLLPFSVQAEKNTHLSPRTAHGVLLVVLLLVFIELYL